jgi:hypothetical protein
VKRRTAAGLALLAALVGAAVAVALYWRDYRPRETGRTRALRAEYEALRAQLETHLSAEPLLTCDEVESGDVVVGIRTPYLGDVIREVSRRYLDRVRLDLAPDIHVREKGELETKTFFGKMKLGDWSVNLNIARLQGVLAGSTPELSIASANTVRVTMPVSIVQGRGSGTVRFGWDSKSVANLVCKDFELTESLEATVLPDRYLVRGGFKLMADAARVVAEPVFPREKYRVRVDLTPESWAKAEAALRSQDTLGKCGLAMNPEQVVSQLRDLGHKGFEFRLPRTLFRPIVLPARIHSEVAAYGTKVAVQVEPRLLRLTDEALWYGVAVRGRLLAPADPRAVPRPQGPRMSRPVFGAPRKTPRP